MWVRLSSLRGDGERSQERAEQDIEITRAQVLPALEVLVQKWR